MAINWVPLPQYIQLKLTFTQLYKRERERDGSCSSAPHEWRNWRNKLCQQLPGSGKLN